MREVRIEDLREPKRTAEEQKLHEMSLGLKVDLRAGDLVDRARKATGLSDLGKTGLVERLEAQVSAVEADAGLSGIGRYILRGRWVGLLKARLRFEDFVRRYPEARDVELEPPVVVVGLPRSGTTHLVNLLGSDSRFRSMPWWEVREPTPVLGEGPGRDGVDPRYTRCLASGRRARRRRRSRR